MPNIKGYSNEILENIKNTGTDELNLARTDFDIIVTKAHSLSQLVLQSLPNFLFAASFFLLCIFANRFICKLLRKRIKVHRSVGVVLERVCRFMFITFGLLVGLAIIFPSLKPADFIGSFGLASLALGFAVKDLLKNFISGILILLQQPFRVGDEIKHKDLEGIVDYINIRYTVLISFDGRKFLIPNGEIYANMIVVNTLSKCRMSNFELNIDLNSDVNATINELLTIITGVHGVMTDPAPKILVSNLTTEKITLGCFWATSPYEHEILTIRSKILKSIQLFLMKETKSATKITDFTQTIATITHKESQAQEEAVASD